MPVVTLNYSAIFVCGIINMALGMLWYGPLFRKPWAKMMGLECTEAKMKEMQKKAMPAYVASFVGALVMAYVLSHFIDYAMAKTAADGAQAGFWAWLGFVAPASLANNMFGGKNIKLWFIDAGYYLVSLLIFGAVLAVWV